MTHGSKKLGGDHNYIMIHVISEVTEKLCDVFIADSLMQRHCALLLTMIFSTGETVPFTLYGKSGVCCPHQV